MPPRDEPQGTRTLRLLPDRKLRGFHSGRNVRVLASDDRINLVQTSTARPKSSMASNHRSTPSLTLLEELDGLKALVEDSVTALLSKLDISVTSASTQSEIDDNITKLDMVLMQYANSIGNRQIVLRRRRNGEAPINRLPIEIFTHIIFLAVGGWEDWDISLLLRAMMVCGTWWDIIHSEPTLWCHLSSYQSDRHNRLVLRRNPSSPLVVNSTSKIWLQHNIQASNPSRWRGFRFKGQLFPAVLEALQSARSLQTLSIAAGTRSTYGDLPQVTLPNPIDLLVLDLESVTVPWSTVQGARLEVLSLQGLRRNSPSTSEILGMLSNSFYLRRLVLQLLNPDDGDDPTPDAWPPLDPNPDRIHLPVLNTVSLRSVPRTLSHAILVRLDAPGCKAMDVFDCHPSHFNPLSQSALPTTIKPILQTARRVVISYSASSPVDGMAIRIETKGPEVRIRDVARPAVTESPGLSIFIPLRNEEDWSCVISSLDLRSLPNSLTLRLTSSWTLALGGGATGTEGLAPSLLVGDRGTSLECIEFDGAFDPIPILQYLSSPQPDGSGSKRWLCPRLKTIIISGSMPWSQARTDELEKWCIAFLQRGFNIRDGLSPPEQVKRMLVHQGNIQYNLYRMREFRDVEFFSVNTVVT